MTLGEQIKKYRQMRGWTQKELGEKVGFKKSTADVRINQYETNKMAPKSEIRSAIAEVLDVDVEALSNTSIKSDEDLMYVMFELEEKYGMRIENIDNSIHLVFDGQLDSKLSRYMKVWQVKRMVLAIDSGEANEEQKRDYELWKSRFVTNAINVLSENGKYTLENDLSQLSQDIKEKLIHLSDTTNIDINTMYIAFEQEMAILKNDFKYEYNKK